jgi:2-polyprenyl-3-methyl-5-hydroxy-6-metoxy-1,4-benzoquinol methylase
MQFYDSKDICYFRNVRFDIIYLIPCGAKNILEIGCGEGDTLLELKKQGKAEYIVGIDIKKFDQETKLDRFLNIEIENSNIPYPDGFFDVIVCADVLEHLINPWETVRRLRRYIAPGGYLIASLPNFREIKNLFTIFVKGDFRYTKEGTLDISHLRFFCKRNIRELFEKEGFIVQRLTYDMNPLSKRQLINRFTFGLIEELLVMQYLVVAIKN